MKNEILTALFVFAISTPAGYLFNDYMTQEKLSIENVEIITHKQKHHIPVKKKTHLESIIRNYKINNDSYFLNLPDSIDIYKLNTFNKELKKSCVAIEFLKKQLNKTKKVLKENPGSIIPASTLLDHCPDCFEHKEGKKYRKKELQKSVNALLEQSKQDIKFLKNIKNDNDKINVERTGDITLVATILNSGNTDGLIKPSGTLIVSGNDSISLPISLIQAPTSSPFNNTSTLISSSIDKRSFQQLGFEIHKYQGKTGNIDKFQKLIRANQSFSLSIRLKDHKDQIIQSKEHTVYPYN